MTQSEPIRIQPVETPPQEGEADAGRMLQILWRGKWILLLVPLLAFAGAKFWLKSQTELFVATATVQVDARTPNILKAGAGEAINKPRTVLKQQQGLLRSTTLLKRVADSPVILGLKGFSPEALEGRTIVGALYDSLQTNIDVESDRLFVSFFSPSREDAVVVVDEALRVYIEYHKEKKREQAEGLAEIVRREWEGAKAELDETSNAIALLQSENTLLAGIDRTPLQTKLDNANTALNGAHIDTQKYRAIYEEMNAAKDDPARFRERGLYWRSKGSIPVLEGKIADIEKAREAKEAELARKERVLGEENVSLAELRAEIDQMIADEGEIAVQYAQEYLRNSDAEYRRAQLLEERLAEELRNLLAQVAEQNQVLDRIKDLQLEREHLRARVSSFDERITQLDLENQTGALNLDVIEYARAAMRPAYPETDKTLIYALGGSGILAFGLVLLLGLADRRVREVEDVPRLLGVSVLGVLPEMPGGGNLAKTARVVEEAPNTLAAEAFRSARAATVFALPNGRGVVAVTSANANEGKSVCASNLAFSFAKAGRKTLLIDADMRRSAQHAIYGVENGVGLAGLLGSSIAVKKAIVESVAVGLDLLPAGQARGKAAELCEGEIFVQLLLSLRDSYDCIVIDMPSVLETSEARVLAALSDAVVFVLRLAHSKAPNIKRAAGILRGAGARISGVLPNCASSKRNARAFAGGISLGVGQANTPGARSSRDTGDEGEETDGKARARGTDFLGLEEESA